MNIPRFPAPPALVSRSISLEPTSTTITVHRRRGGGGGEYNNSSSSSSGKHHRRPRSASWLVARKRRGISNNLISTTAATIAANGRNFILSNSSYASARNNHVQPLACADSGCLAARDAFVESNDKRPRTEVQVTMTESRYDDEPDRDGRAVESCVGVKVLEMIREDPSSCCDATTDGNKSASCEEEDCSRETEIVCRSTTVATAVGMAADAKLATESTQRCSNNSPYPLSMPAIPERLSPIRPMYYSVPPLTQRKLTKAQSVQTTDRILYRLRVFPTLKDIVDEEAEVASNGGCDAKKRQQTKKKSSGRIFRFLRFLGRLALCQFGLAWLLTLWAVAGASLFYVTEGPRERQQVVELKDMQRDLAVGLATELRQLRAEDRELEPLWSSKVRQYVARHEKLLLMAVSSGYGEGGDNGQLWTLPGCVLFSISVLTTLGFGAPVPRTNAGRTVAVVFASIGIPAHFLLILNLGLMLAVRLKRYGIRRKYPNECRDLETIDSMPMPMWVKVVPFVAIAIYYVLGIMCFGVGRYRPFSDSLLFPLDFTAAGGLSTTAGYIRILYGLYLEGAVTLTAIAVAIMKVAATQSLTNIGLRYGLLVPA